MLSQEVIDSIRTIKDVPIPGILFRDITTLLMDYRYFGAVIDEMEKILKPYNITKLAGIESRGFFFACALAERMKVGFVPIRKPGKLPYKVYEEKYTLEYGENTLCIHQDAITPDDRVALIDDLIATGGSVNAAINLCEKCGSIPKIAVALIEIGECEGSKAIKKCPCETLMKI